MVEREELWIIFQWTVIWSLLGGFFLGAGKYGMAIARAEKRERARQWLKQQEKSFIDYYHADVQAYEAAAGLRALSDKDGEALRSHQRKNLKPLWEEILQESASALVNSIGMGFVLALGCVGIHYLITEHILEANADDILMAWTYGFMIAFLMSLRRLQKSDAADSKIASEFQRYVNCFEDSLKRKDQDVPATTPAPNPVSAQFLTSPKRSTVSADELWEELSEKPDPYEAYKRPYL